MTETPVFDLPPNLSAKADRALIAADVEHFAAIDVALRTQLADLTARLEVTRLAPARGGQLALDRDLEVHRLTARIRALRRFGLDACLGRVVPADGSPPTYIGRFGLSDADGRRLLVDWRAPAAEPYFAATFADPRGLASRRRYRWGGGRVRDYWDEAFTAEAAASGTALDDESAFIASLGTSRSPRMRDVLSTIQADQDAIIRADSAGALVVDGGPGTGKTVVALHRAAYLLHADARLGEGHGGVLVVGPHEPYLAFVADVLPALGEDSVQTCTLRDLVREGADAAPEGDPRIARLKADARLVDAIEPAVRLYEEPPTRDLVVATPWMDLLVTATDWAESFASAEPGLPHNDARDQVWESLLDILADQVDPDAVAPHLLRRALVQNEELGRAFTRAWPLVEASVLVADLWTVPAYLRRCAPWLSPDEVAALQRPAGSAWTLADLPLLDAARRRLGDPAASRDRRVRRARLDAEREYMAQVVDRLKEAGDELMQWMDGDDLRNSLVDEAVLTPRDADLLAGPFAHVIVDEAQELTDAQWRMLLARCPSRSFTIVGDRAQARHGFTESWEERLDRVGFTRVRRAELRVNYRTPAEVMAEAEPVIRAAIPDANVPTSIRSSGIAVRRGTVGELRDVLEEWLAAHAEGVACVILAADGGVLNCGTVDGGVLNCGTVDGGVLDGGAVDGGVLEDAAALLDEAKTDAGFWSDVADSSRVRVLTPETAKGLEFDLVVLVEPERFGDGIEGAVDRYVAMTRATSTLVVLE
ncbi:hypothetical protein JOD63_000523 [Microbacterium terrae]|uniref:Helicase IV n=1 Tax=Microbacterium terrae TaxID=69369 RepID=A0A0M2H2D2_9MICO|nr:RNA polymerase recycling motor ATPase HelR [Microbacterium terrae]KJL37723.1 Helicase IV [Microbacterium terrae]MBP1076555.1 hypothetical protein [Microbacterium terrae]GLJ97384.1 DNA helicase [Microbacterium terrae]